MRGRRRCNSTNLPRHLTRLTLRDFRNHASTRLEDTAAFNVLKKLTLTTDQQNEIAAMIDGEGMAPADAAQKWVDANPDVWKAWLS